MSARRASRGLQSPGRQTVVVPLGVSRSLVQSLYDAMFEALKSGENIDAVLERHVPLLLNELDKMMILYDYVPYIVVSVFKKLWRRWFRNIPCPELDPKEIGGARLHSIITDTLMKHREKIVEKTRKYMTSTADIEQYVHYTVLSFLNSLLTTVFHLMGVVV